MNHNIEKQIDFQTRFNQPVLNLHDVPSVPDRIKRLRLAFEELTELATAMGVEASFKYLVNKHLEDKGVRDTLKYNETEVLDALVDIEVINNGSIIECGMQSVFNEAYDEVHSSNMSKAVETIEEAEDEADNYITEHHEAATIEQTPDNWFLLKRPDGKIIKPSSYTKANLVKVLEKS